MGACSLRASAVFGSSPSPMRTGDDRSESLSGSFRTATADNLDDLRRASFGVDECDRVDTRDIQALAENLHVGQKSVDIVAQGEARE